MKILIACEESQAVCIAMRNNGHEAYSCDIQECSGGHPEWHIMQDALPLINGDCTFATMDGQEHRIDGEWDLLIAHPPCTYLSNAGACRMYPEAGCISEDRLKLATEAKKLFMAFLGAKCRKIAVENPKPLKIVGLPQSSQSIEPCHFGEPYTKKPSCGWSACLR